jgi:hypothetical protein
MSGTPPERKSLASLWLIVALAAAPVAGSYLYFHLWQPGRTVNYGELIGPVALPDAQLALADGTPFRFSRLRGKWVIAMADSGRCDAYCEKKLIYMRQLRLTQGKHMERVERAWLVTDGVSPRAGLLEPYEGTWVLRAGGSAVLELLSARGAPADYIYVIDPLGNLMMRFPRDPDPKGMVRDLTRLLKVSRVG